MLRDDGHEVRADRAAMEIPTAATASVGVAIVDQNLPLVKGIELADSLHAHHPDLPIILISGCHPHQLEPLTSSRPFIRFRAKPFFYDDLHALMHGLSKA